MDIKNLNKNIEFLQSKVQELSIQNIDGDSFILDIQIKNLQSEIQNLQSKLKEQNTLRNKEVISLRLIGDIAKNGTFPLISVAGITDNFAKALFKTSQYLQYGNKKGKKIERTLAETLDLRLEKIGHGSTIFYISAKTNPDLFGESIIQNSLGSSFNLLESSSSEQIIDNVGMIGIESSKYFKNLFKEIIKDDLEVEIIWEDVDYTQKKWFGSKDKLLTFYNSFESINASEPEFLNDDFEIITLSLKHKIEVRNINTNKIITIKYPNSLTEYVKSLKIGEVENIDYYKISIINNITKVEKKVDYMLLEKI